MEASLVPMSVLIGHSKVRFTCPPAPPYLFSIFCSASTTFCATERRSFAFSSLLPRICNDAGAPSYLTGLSATGQRCGERVEDIAPSSRRTLRYLHACQFFMSFFAQWFTVVVEAVNLAVGLGDGNQDIGVV